jgi:adenylate cyclase
MSNWLSLATALQGWALFKQGDVEAIRMTSEGINNWQSYGITHLTPYLLSLKAQCLRQLSQTVEALQAIHTAIDLAQRGSDANWLAELYRIQGLLLYDSGAGSPVAEASFVASIDTARQQGARMLELRATRDLANLWRDQGRVQPARQALLAVYDQFTEGFDTVELKSARGLLEELAATGCCAAPAVQG